MYDRDAMSRLALAVLKRGIPKDYIWPWVDPHHPEKGTWKDFWVQVYNVRHREPNERLPSANKPEVLSVC